MSLSWYKADLHIHTVLSACAELSMGPRDIAEKASAVGMDIIAVTDHNSAENVAAVVQAAESVALMVIPGIEVYVREEAHLICLFENMDKINNFQDFIYSVLQEGENDVSWFGSQYVCNSHNDILAENKKMLSMPLKTSMEKVCDRVAQQDGIVYPAHIDRKSFSILRVLGFIPDNLPFSAIEISQPLDVAKQQLRFLSNTKYTIIRASDAHDIDHVGSAFTSFYIQRPVFSELVLALQGRDGRKCAVDN
ncbi:PHP domain-containing protein [candidate division KSB1 bacterium]|nr:PHP domain-containing protein [candidate division KSB1 bacterium]